jgi:hypothetical protein
MKSCGSADLRDSVAEAEQPRTGQLVEVADVAVVGQRGHRDVGDVVGIHERLLHMVDRQRHRAGEHLVEPCALVEVCAKNAHRTIVHSSPATTSARPGPGYRTVTTLGRR